MACIPRRLNYKRNHYNPPVVELNKPLATGQKWNLLATTWKHIFIEKLIHTCTCIDKCPIVEFPVSIKTQPLLFRTYTNHMKPSVWLVNAWTLPATEANSVYTYWKYLFTYMVHIQKLTQSAPLQLLHACPQKQTTCTCGCSQTPCLPEFLCTCHYSGTYLLSVHLN